MFTFEHQPMADAQIIVTWEALGKFSIAGLCEKYKTRAIIDLS